MVDSDTVTLRTQALLMQRLSPEERLRRVLGWSMELMQASFASWMRDSTDGEPCSGQRLDAWIRAQHDDDVAPGFTARRAAWQRRQGLS